MGWFKYKICCWRKLGC